MEIIKIKTAVPGMIDAIEKGSEKDRIQVIENLDVIYRIVNDVTLKEDMRTIQKLLKSKDSYMYTYAVHMLSDLSMYGIDGTKKKVTLEYPDGITAWVDGWFSDQDQNGNRYWNCFMMDIVGLKEIKECHIILE